jgi:anti-sigma B factor antagonist
MRANDTFGLHADDDVKEMVAASGRSPDDASGADESKLAFSVTERALDQRTSVLNVEGELDLAAAPSLKWALADVVQAGATQLVVDLSRVTFIDSTALGVLVGAHRSLSAGARLAITCRHPDVLNIFELTGLDATFDIFPTFEDALAYARGDAIAAD